MSLFSTNLFVIALFLFCPFVHHLVLEKLSDAHHVHEGDAKDQSNEAADLEPEHCLSRRMLTVVEAKFKSLSGRAAVMLKGRAVKGVLLDITGVLVESSATGDGKAIPGSVEAVRKLKDAGEDRMTLD